MYRKKREIILSALVGSPRLPARRVFFVRHPVTMKLVSNPGASLIAERPKKYTPAT
ncbi:hypothetical protein JWG43_02725 [Desulfobulbus alkaliphilus]|nr:hypothetical protein [Desulfobulbus alkaliphilus]